jgi:hypothetical protein
VGHDGVQSLESSRILTLRGICLHPKGLSPPPRLAGLPDLVAARWSGGSDRRHHRP